MDSIKRIAVAAALLAAFATSGCGTIESLPWGSAAASQQKLPGDSPG